MSVISLVPSDSPTLISSLLRLSAHHLALAASAAQPLKSGTLSLYHSVPVPVLIPFVVTSRPTTARRLSNPLNPSPLSPQIRLCWPLCAFINYIYLLTYTVLTYKPWTDCMRKLVLDLRSKHARTCIVPAWPCHELYEFFNIVFAMYLTAPLITVHTGRECNNILFCRVA